MEPPEVGRLVVLAGLCGLVLALATPRLELQVHFLCRRILTVQRYGFGQRLDRCGEVDAGEKYFEVDRAVSAFGTTSAVEHLPFWVDREPVTAAADRAW